MSKFVEIAADTVIWTFTSSADGCSLLDAILGDRSASDYYLEARDSDTAVAQLCDWLGGMIGEGFYLSEQDAIDAVNDCRLTPESFTPEEIHDEIMKLGEAEAEDN